MPQCRWTIALALLVFAIELPAKADDASAPVVEATNDRFVFLVAARQKARVRQALEQVGITVVSDLLESRRMLRVTIGNEKGFRACGTRNNVKFSLREDGTELLLLSGAGWTGECEPSVLDELASRLARELGASEGGEP